MILKKNETIISIKEDHKIKMQECRAEEGG